MMPGDPSARKRPSWGFPKAHGMLHVRETLRLYGSVAEVSAEAMERRHMSLKARFRKVERGPRAGLQVLMAEMKAEQASRQAEQVCGPEAGASQGIPPTPGVNASFGQNLHESGRKYPVWLAMLHHKQCLCEMTVPALTSRIKHLGIVNGPRLVLSLTHLFDKTSFWCAQAWEMQHLPEHMAKFIRDYLPALMPEDIPRAHVDNLSWRNIQALCDMVQQPESANGNGHHLDRGHLLVHHAWSITHPGTKGQVPPCRTCT